jgi:hypothetical protein
VGGDEQIDAPSGSRFGVNAFELALIAEHAPRSGRRARVILAEVGLWCLIVQRRRRGAAARAAGACVDPGAGSVSVILASLQAALLAVGAAHYLLGALLWKLARGSFWW